jgi:large subunit ribosomal protein L15
MARRIRNKGKHRYHGTRHWGRGNIKHGRGKGSQGGKGFGGSHKQKWGWILRYHPDHFGREPMASLKKERPNVLNLWELNQMILNGKLPKGADGKYRVEMPDCKVLGTGKLEFPVSIRAFSFSKCATEKIRGAGGEAKAGE